MEEKQNKNEELNNFFSDKIFIYALVASVLVTIIYFFTNNFYWFIRPFPPEIIELLIPSIIWIIYLIIERTSLVCNGTKIFKLASNYAIWLIPITLILKIINFDIITPIPIYFDSKPNNWSYFISGTIYLTLGRTIIIYIWITFINLICRIITNAVKFIFKK